jgi:DNA repair exonuclease SbcCD nuclease subunit
MIRILHLADIHLGARLQHLSQEKNRVELRNDLKKTFEDIITFCITPGSRIDLVLICGNLFDSHVPEQPLFYFVQQQLNRLLKNNVSVFIIPGSFDSNIYSDSIYKESYFSRNINLITEANVSYIQTVEINEEKVNLYGMAYSHFTREPVDIMVKNELPGYHVVMINNATVYGEQFLRMENLRRSGFDYIALGGLPNFEQHEYDSLIIVYPGMVEPVKRGATEPRKLCVLECQNGLLKTYPLENKFNQKLYKTISIDLNKESYSNEKEIATYLEEKYTNYSQLLRLELKGKANFLLNTDRLSRRLSHFFFHVEIDDRTEFDYQYYLSQIRGNDNIDALYLKKIAERFKSVNSDNGNKQIIQAMNIGLTLNDN